MAQLTKLAEGKTKIIYANPNSGNEVLVTSKDDITAGDGAKRDLLSGKAALATRTTSNCFELLEAHGVSTHFLGRVDETTFRAKRVEMIPLELVARRVATGSYLKRNPQTEEGRQFSTPELEWFLKDDSRHDPFVLLDSLNGRLHLFDPKRPLAEGYLGVETPPWLGAVLEAFDSLMNILHNTFVCLEDAWAEQNVSLIDLKVECGFPADDGRPVLADVVDNDSWRIWREGQKSLMVDKQLYRDLVETTPAAMQEIQAKYAWVADATDKFVA